MFRMNREPRQGVQNPINTLPLKPKPVYRIKEWMTGMSEQDCPEIKSHIFNFFVSEGYTDLAITFAKEAGIDVIGFDQEEISLRLKVKNLIKQNSFEEAIQIIKKHSKTQNQKIENNLIFSLRCLKVIELIKDKKFDEAIQTASKELTPYIANNLEHIDQIEKVMSLIAFINIKDCPNSHLASKQYKDRVAENANRYLFTGNEDSYHTLKALISVGKWVESRLEQYVDFPKFDMMATGSSVMSQIERKKKKEGI